MRGYLGTWMYIKMCTLPRVVQKMRWNVISVLENQQNF